MSKERLDKKMVSRKLAASRSQAENLINLGLVTANGIVAGKPGQLVGPDDKIQLLTTDTYVSRAALKLKSVAAKLKLDFKGKVVLDVGSSTGGFTDFALRQGAKKVIAIDVGTNQLHPSLRDDQRIELHEKTDIRGVAVKGLTSRGKWLEIEQPNIIIVDVSFISVREILPHIHSSLATDHSSLVVMVKPQFEAGTDKKHKGVIKNDKMRRQILTDFENWAQKLFTVADKADSEVAGHKGNLERFYLLRRAPDHK